MRRIWAKVAAPAAVFGLAVSLSGLLWLVLDAVGGAPDVTGAILTVVLAVLVQVACYVAAKRFSHMPVWPGCCLLVAAPLTVYAGMVGPSRLYGLDFQFLLRVMDGVPASPIHYVALPGVIGGLLCGLVFAVLGVWALVQDVGIFTGRLKPETDTPASPAGAEGPPKPRLPQRNAAEEGGDAATADGEEADGEEADDKEQEEDTPAAAGEDPGPEAAEEEAGDEEAGDEEQNLPEKGAAKDEAEAPQPEQEPQPIQEPSAGEAPSDEVGAAAPEQDEAGAAQEATEETADTAEAEQQAPEEEEEQAEPPPAREEDVTGEAPKEERPEEAPDKASERPAGEQAGPGEESPAPPENAPAGPEGEALAQDAAKGTGPPEGETRKESGSLSPPPAPAKDQVEAGGLAVVTRMALGAEPDKEKDDNTTKWDKEATAAGTPAPPEREP